MTFMGRRWSRYEFGIALGFGLQASAELIVSTKWTKDLGYISELPLIAFDAACLIWLITFLKPEKTAPAPTQSVSPEVLEEAKKWQETLQESLSGREGSLND